MNEKWNTVKPARCAKWLVLPTVYSDALSYGEQLDKFCFQLNQLIENNNILPDFISEMIKEFINSGAIGEVVRDILANYILNVKYPPEGITPAVGDGTADDTAAIQGCINYAAENGGVVYFPYGSYLTQPLTMKDGVSLFGFDRYSTKIVLKGGATKALISGTIDGFSIANLTLDGNSGIQVNDVNVVDIMATDMLMTNLIIKDGYNLVNYHGTGGHFQISDVVFGNAVKKCLITAGNANIQAENLVFNQLSAVGGISVIDIGTNGGFFNVKSVATCNQCIVVTGNNNNISAIIENATIPVVDNGLQNNIEIVGVSKKLFVSGNVVDEIGGNKSIKANNFSETVSGTKTVETSVLDVKANNFSETVTKTKTVEAAVLDIKADNFSETVTKTKTVEAAVLDVKADKLIYKTPTTNYKATGANSLLEYYDSNEDVHYICVEGKPIKTIYTSDFGAIGDGLADDTTALQNAINFASENGYALCVSPGKYKTSSPLIVPSNSYIYSPPYAGATFLNQFAGGCFNVSNANVVWFNNLDFAFNENTNLDECCFYGENFFGLNLNNIQQGGQSYSGATHGSFLIAKGSSRNIMLNNVFIDCGGVDGYAIKLDLDVAERESDIVIRNSFIDNYQGKLLYIKNASDVWIVGSILRCKNDLLTLTNVDLTYSFCYLNSNVIDCLSGTLFNVSEKCTLINQSVVTDRDNVITCAGYYYYNNGYNDMPRLSVDKFTDVSVKGKGNRNRSFNPYWVFSTSNTDDIKGAFYTGTTETYNELTFNFYSAAEGFRFGAAITDGNDHYLALLFSPENGTYALIEYTSGVENIIVPWRKMAGCKADFSLIRGDDWTFLLGDGTGTYYVFATHAFSSTSKVGFIEITNNTFGVDTVIELSKCKFL